MLQTFQKATEQALAAIREEMTVRKTTEVFLLFTMGSQFDHLIKMALERLGVYCLVADPAKTTVDDVRILWPTGIVISGGPASVHSEPPPFDYLIFDLGIPVLGICLGYQMWAKHIGVEVKAADKREFGPHDLVVTSPDYTLFYGCPRRMKVLESHGDRVEPCPHFEITASTDNALAAAARHNHLHGLQFHPECTETEYGPQIFENFCFRICGARDRYPAQDVAQQKIAHLREQTRDKRVLLALSGGSDSSTVAYLLKEAMRDNGGKLRGVYIKGIDRPDDEAHARQYFGHEDWLEFRVVDETEAFLAAVKGKTSMSDKRLAMKFGVYQRVLEREIQEYAASLVAQGTLYTDNSESGLGYTGGARKAVIKHHHNTGLQFSVPELTPLDDCVKDSGRNIGRSIGVPEALLTRHPFPGPGLLLRVEGEVTAEKLAMAHWIDDIYISELRKWNLYDSVWQAGAVVTVSTHTVSMGDDAGSHAVVCLWAVWSVNGFTARWAELPVDFQRHVSRRITNEVKGAGAITYRISDKPPTTIEWG